MYRSNGLSYQDVRKKRKYDVSNVHPVIADTNQFNRNLMMEIMRTLGIANVDGARDENTFFRLVDERKPSVIFIECSELNEMDPMALSHKLRRLNTDHSRRIPVIAMSSVLTKKMVIDCRAAGVDEFLKKPCSPKDVEQRLKMVIETPRPFVDSPTYIGPCRRRKNPADYHGPRRREKDTDARVSEITDAERQLIDAEAPLTAALAQLKLACKLLASNQVDAYARVLPAIVRMHEIAKSNSDTPVVRALMAFETFILAIAANPKSIPAARSVLITAISTLEQLVVLPREYDSARETVSNAFSDAIERRLAS